LARAIEPVRRLPSPERDIGPRFVELAHAIAQRIRRQPLTSAAVVLGLGFAIGGALTFRAGRIALAAAARHLANEILKQVL
jgi:hypothetical protein